jgi:hypothetical protein
METVSSKGKKRKNIDIPEDTFRALSVLAAANGKNLKAYIETVLIDEANILLEENVYRELLMNPEANELVSQTEKAAFEKWLGV